MPTPSTLRPCPPASPQGLPDALLLRDVVSRHAEPLAQLLHDHLAVHSASAGRDFQAGVAAWRQQGPLRFSSWLFGITLGLLRESGAGDAGQGQPAACRPAAGGPATGDLAAPRPEAGSSGSSKRAPPATAAIGFADRLALALPPALATPLLTLARSGLAPTRCALFLCKPADIALSGELNRIQT